MHFFFFFFKWRGRGFYLEKNPSDILLIFIVCDLLRLISLSFVFLPIAFLFCDILKNNRYPRKVRGRYIIKDEEIKSEQKYTIIKTPCLIQIKMTGFLTIHQILDCVLLMYAYFVSMAYILQADELLIK